MQSPRPFPEAVQIPDGLPDDRPIWIVDISHQRIWRNCDQKGWLSAPVSTSCWGTGNTSGSHQTPLGLHEISEVIGDGAEPGQPFASRIPSGPPLPPAQWQEGDGDKILSRILWLKGLEEQNTDSYSRYIYLHGTNQEHLLGTPASQGCVRMANRTIIAWADTLSTPLPYVWIGHAAQRD